MTIYPLSIEEIAAKGVTHVVTLTYADFSAAALTKTVDVLPATLAAIGTEIFCKGFYVATAFAGCATATLKLGDGGDDDRYLTAALCHLKTAGYKSMLPTLATQPFTLTSAGAAIQAIATATTDNLDQLSAGVVHLYLRVINLAKLIQ